MKKVILFVGLLGLFICLGYLGEVVAQTYYTNPGAFVTQSGPQARWCSGPHTFKMDITAKVHHWIFAYIQSTRIHYDVWKPGNYHVRKKLFAMSNEPISITISGVNHLVHQENAAFPRIHHGAALSPDPPTADEIIAMTDPALADIVHVDEVTGEKIYEPQPMPTEELHAFLDWPPGTRMPQALSDYLELETPPIGEPAKNTDIPGVAAVPDATLGTEIGEDLTELDQLLLERGPEQFGEDPIQTIAGDPFILRKWLHDWICVGFWNRSCNYVDPGGYTITITAHPVYCSDGIT